MKKRLFSFIVAMMMLCTSNVAVYANSLEEHSCLEHEHFENVSIDAGNSSREMTWLCTTFGCRYDDTEIGTGGACYYRTDPSGASCYTYPVEKAYCKWCGRQILFETGERRYGSCLFVTNHTPGSSTTSN